MSLADRFKEKMKNQNKFETENKVSLTKPELMQNTNNIEELRIKAINKIKKTPYWQDYTVTAQENMVLHYLESKTRDNKNISVIQKNNFVKDVLNSL